MRIMKRRVCPCCGFYTVENDDVVCFDICEICSWQYDEVAHDKLDTMKGANAVTLSEARNNFKSFGASEKRFIGKGRKPFPEELPENN